jgi:Zn-dependent peptidase ImmA (M78 family)
VPDDELALHQLRSVFLDYVEEVHQKHEFECDYRLLASSLEITVRYGNTNQAVTANSQRLILIDSTTAPNRERFTGLHEIAHHLFEIAEEGYLRARLKDLFYRRANIARAYEEQLCNAAAAQLLMPRHCVDTALGLHGYTPLAALKLVAECGASVQAAVRRVVWSRYVPTFAFLLAPTGMVIDAFGHGHPKDYSPGMGFIVEDGHELRMGQYSAREHAEFDAPVPFRHGRRGWTMRVRACCDHYGRIVAFFNPRDVIVSTNADQLDLF